MPEPTAPPPLAPRSLQGPLQLELSRGCLDDAVAEGTGAFVARCARRLSELSPADLTGSLRRMAQAFDDYASLSSAERHALCRRALTALALYARRWSPARNVEPAPDSPLTCLRGVGPSRAERLAALGLHTVADLLRHYPTRHDDRRALLPITALEHRQTACLRVTIAGPGEVIHPRGHARVEVPAREGATPLRLVWFNQPYQATRYTEGTDLLVTGQVMLRNGQFFLQVAEVETLEAGDTDSLGALTPIYPLTAGVTQGFLRRLMRQALDRCRPLPADVVPPGLLEARGFGSLDEALHQIHFPTDDNARRRARGRIAYEELFLLQAALASRRQVATREDGRAAVPARELLREFLAALPFSPTDAQRQVCEDLAADLERPAAASRLVHGDVGSGKTVCAAFALACAARAGRQAALMAPTELLAEQHWRTISRLLAPLGLRCTLLTGSLRAGERSRRQDDLLTARTDIAIGTHALFQESMRFSDLAVAVVDEQHRFGVRQRADLSSKGAATNVFVMSATPIPRTLALTAYGEFDVSVLGQLPPGRQPVVTHLVWREDHGAALETVAALMARGQQAYIVCPLIEADDDGSLASAEQEHYRLSNGPFAGFRVGLLHGRVEPQTRDAIMEDFRDHRLDALVATTVIEVGVDIPNATVMLVQNAERFGLAQLHQLRGRVSRGTEAGRFIMLTRARAPEVISRLRVLERTTDGFEVAEEDLRRRGPGELAGVRQSGLPDLRMADLIADTPTLVQAREDAFALLAKDPALALPEHLPLRQALARTQSDSDPWNL